MSLLFIIHLYYSNIINSYVGCIYLLDILNSATMNVHVHALVPTSLSVLHILSVYVDLVVELGSHMIIPCVTFWGSIKLFSTMAIGASFCIPTSNVLFNYNHRNGYDMVYFIVVLNFISLKTNYVGHLFMCLLAICTTSLKKCIL